MIPEMGKERTINFSPKEDNSRWLADHFGARGDPFRRKANTSTSGEGTGARGIRGRFIPNIGAQVI